MNALPFLKPKGWPKLRKYAGESRYGFSEDDELIEHALDELLEAVQSKDHRKLTSAIMALVDVIMTREANGEEQDAPDTQQEA